MSSVLFRAAAMLRDIAVAYAGGLALGAPLAAASVWLTGRDVLVTPLLLLCMGGVWLGVRRSAARRRPAASAPGGREDCRAA